MTLNTTEAIIEDLRQGKMVIVMDDEGRENEGDLIIAATAVRPEDINFMAQYGRGLICLTLSQQRCQQLDLPLMTKQGQVPHATNFTLSIEAAQGVTTGISAADRTTTIRAATKPDAQPADIVTPGHVFPLMAQDGGVLVRAGHTEAGCDLARLAGFEPAAVIVEILNPDGSMARRPDLEEFAHTHQLKIGTIEDLIRYRITNETAIQRSNQLPFHSAYGEFELVTFHDKVHKVTHMALVKGPIDPAQISLVRVHVENPLYDLFAAQPTRGWPLQDALARIAAAEQGVFVFLTRPHTETAILQHSKEYRTQAQPQPDSDTQASSSPADWRTFGIGAQILAELGVRKMQILSAPKIFHGLAAFDLEIIDYVSP